MGKDRSSLKRRLSRRRRGRWGRGGGRGMSWACYPGMQWLPAATMAVRRRGLEGGGGWQLGTLQPPDSTLQAQQHGFQKAIWKLCTAVPLGACERYCGPRHPSRLARGGGGALCPGASRQHAARPWLHTGNRSPSQAHRRVRTRCTAHRPL